MKYIKLITIIFILAVLPIVARAEEYSNPRLGVWVSVFSTKEPFSSKENADKLIKVCNDKGISDIYLQVYRSNKAYYDSSITDKASFDKNKNSFGEDPVNYILKEAKKNNIAVHAWINLLSVALNNECDIIKKFSREVLTVDQRGVTSDKSPRKDIFHKRFILENQLFLEPGDPRVKDYLVSIVNEIITRYPDFSGVHLDYIRYPGAVPFAPGSRFDSHSISYGYGGVNTKKFKENTGLDVKTMEKTPDNFLAWDAWRRSKVTELVNTISQNARKVKPTVEMSCAVIPSPDRSYLVYFQDWVKWINDQSVDYAVLMLYTNDEELVKLYSQLLLSGSLRKKIFVGLGAYLLKDNWQMFEKELTRVKSFSPSGIVIFSYDELELLEARGLTEPVHNSAP